MSSNNHACYHKGKSITYEVIAYFHQRPFFWKFGLVGSLSYFFCHISQNRSFEDKWHGFLQARNPSYHPTNVRQRIDHNQCSNPIFFHHQTPD